MKKILLGFLLLLFTLTFNACVRSNIVTNSNQEIIPITTIPTPEIIHIPKEPEIVIPMPIQTPRESEIVTPMPIQTPREPEIVTPMPIQTPREPEIVTPMPIQTPREPEIVTPMPIQTPTRAIVIAPSSAGEAHQLKTVQGPILTVQERSNGFVFPQYQNKIVLLQIFGKDCPYCFKEQPIINRIKQRYAGNLQIVAIQAQDPMSQQTASGLIQKFHMNYPIIDKEEARDLLYFLQETYGWTGILPYMLLIKNGVTEYSFPGEVSHQELEEAVQSLI